MEELHYLNYCGAIYRKSQLFIKAALSDRNMNFSDAMVLIHVCANAGTIQDDIAINLSMDKSVVARSIKVLVSSGLVTRQEDPSNQRVKKVYATESAEEFTLFWNKIIAKWNKTILASLTQEERTAAVETSYKIKMAAISADIQNEIKEIE
jgi:DNA-binding MarR family transcriptional regulator